MIITEAFVTRVDLVSKVNSASNLKGIKNKKLSFCLEELRATAGTCVERKVINWKEINFCSKGFGGWGPINDNNYNGGNNNDKDNGMVTHTGQSAC